VKRQPAVLVIARALEVAGLDFEGVVAAVAVGIEPLADGIAGIGRLVLGRKPLPSV
jgi:hypothetical protein